VCSSDLAEAAAKDVQHAEGVLEQASQELRKIQGT